MHISLSIPLILLVINIYVYRFSFTYSCRNTKRGEGERVWDNNKDIKWDKEQIMERIPCFFTVVWFAQHPQPMAASMTSTSSRRGKTKRGGGTIMTLWSEQRRTEKAKYKTTPIKQVHLSGISFSPREIRIGLRKLNHSTYENKIWMAITTH